MISAVIITKNSENTIRNCIISLQGVVDEILVIDSGSLDSTIKIAHELGSKVVETEWKGYGLTKNLGHELASNPYILSLDSDEELSIDLKKEIKHLKHSLNGYYEIKRLNRFGRKWIRHGAWYPDRKIRIFPKSTLWNDSPSHEKLMLDNALPIHTLNGELLHHAYNNIKELKHKTFLYARLGAKGKRGKSKFLAFVKMLFSPLVSFIKSYFLKRGLMDGREGLIISYYIALGTFLKYKFAIVED